MRRALACVLALAAGCSTPVVEQPAEPAYPAAQSWALDDGVVTETEYRTAIDGFVSCMRRFDHDVTDPVLSPIDGLTLLFDLHPAGDPDVWNENLEECDSSFVSHVEPTYVEARDQVMEPSLREGTAQCLTDRGLRLDGEEQNVEDFVDTTGNADNIVLRCVSTTMERLFPTYPGFLKIRW